MDLVLCSSVTLFGLASFSHHVGATLGAGGHHSNVLRAACGIHAGLVTRHSIESVDQLVTCNRKRPSTGAVQLPAPHLPGNTPTQHHQSACKSVPHFPETTFDQSSRTIGTMRNVTNTIGRCVGHHSLQLYVE